MKLLKVAIASVLLAGAAWMPSFANGLGELNQVTTDPDSAYTLYLDMPIGGVESAFDGLKDWTKQKELIKNPYDPWHMVVRITYTRTLQDKTKQKVIVEAYKGIVDRNIFEFYTGSKEETQQMFEQALANLKNAQKWIFPIGDNTDNNRIVMYRHDGLNIYLDKDLKNHMFRMTKYYVDLK